MNIDQAKLEKKDSAIGLKIIEMTVAGGLTSENVRNAAEKQLPALRRCLPTAQAAAKVTIKLTIDAKGAVRAVEIVSMDIRDRAVLQCLQRVAKGWKFGSSTPGKETEASFTFQIGS
jgi:hypothetical protein